MLYQQLLMEARESCHGSKGRLPVKGVAKEDGRVVSEVSNLSRYEKGLSA